MGCDGGTLLVATAGFDVNVYKSIRNLADVSVLPVARSERLERVAVASGC